MKHIFLLAIVAIFFSTLRAANPVDSLENVVKTTKIDSVRVIALYRLCKYYIQQDPAKAASYADLAYENAQKAGYRRGMFWALLAKHGGATYQNKFQDALRFAKEAFEISKKEEKAVLLFSACKAVGTSFISLEKYDSAYFYIEVGEREIKKLPSSEVELADLQDLKAVIRFQFNDFQGCIDEYYKLETFFKAKNNHAKLVKIYHAIGLCYMKLEEYDESLKYYNLGLKSAEIAREKIPTIPLLTGIGGVLFDQKHDYAASLVKYQEAMKLSLETGENYYRGGIIFGLIGNLVELGRISEARPLLDSLLQKAIRENNNGDFAYYHRWEGKNYMKQGNYTAAITHLEKAAAYAKALGSGGLAEQYYIYKPLTEAYKKAGNYQKAFDTQELQMAVVDSIQIADQKSRAETGKWIKALDDEKLAQAVQIKAQAIELATQNRLMWLGIAVATATSLLMILAAVFFWRERQQKKRILILKREALHRIRNNFQTMTNLFDRRIRLSDSEESSAAYREMKSSFLVTTALFQKLEALTDDAAPDVPLHESIQEVAASISSLWKLPAKIDTSGVQPQVVDAGSALPVLLTLAEWLTNAFKYAFSDAATDAPEVTLGLSAQQGQLQLVVADNGRGLPPGFDWQTAQSTGTSLARTFAKQLKGSCSVLPASVGTVCTLSFPIKHFKD